MDDVLLIAVLLVILVAIVAVFASKKDKRRKVDLVAKSLMTTRERAAIQVLEAMLPDCRIHAQVALAAILTTRKGLGQKERTGLRNRFDRKILDFVAEHRQSGAIVALIELDDSTHDETKDASRDAMTSAAGYRTIRIPARTKLDREALDPIFASLRRELAA